MKYEKCYFNQLNINKLSIKNYIILHIFPFKNLKIYILIYQLSFPFIINFFIYLITLKSFH